MSGPISNCHALTPLPTAIPLRMPKWQSPIDKPAHNGENFSLVDRFVGNPRIDNIARIYDLIQPCPVVQVDLLTAAPPTTNPADWTLPAVPGYEPVRAVCQAQAVGASTDGLYYSIECQVFAPQGQSYQAAAVGVSLNGVGLGVAVLPGPVSISGSQPFTLRFSAQVNPVL